MYGQTPKNKKAAYSNPSSLFLIFLCQHLLHILAKILQMFFDNHSNDLQIDRLIIMSHNIITV